MKTIFYVGRSYPHASTLSKLKRTGYSLGILHDKTRPLKNETLFDYILEFDFSSEAAFEENLLHADLPHIDGLLCVYENYIVFKAIAAAVLSLPSLSIDAARACTDKYLMRSRFLNYDPKLTPEFTFVESTEQLLEFAATTGYPLIMKPTNLVKSLLVTRCNNETELLRAYKTTIAQIDSLYQKQQVTNRTPGVIVERFVVGSMCSVAAFVDNKGIPHFCDGIVELVTAQDIGYDDSFLYSRKIATDYQSDLQSQLFAVASDGIAALGMQSSPAHIEIIFNDHETKLVEIGARTGGYRPFLYEESYGIDMIEQEARIATRQQPELSENFVRYAAMYELFPHKKSTFVALRNAKDPKSYRYFHQTAQPGDTIGRAEDGYRAVAIIGIADTDKDSFVSACNDIEKIDVVTQ